MKYQTTSLKYVFAAKGAIYYVAVAMVIFSCVKISCFHAKSSPGISLGGRWFVEWDVTASTPGQTNARGF